MKKIFTLCICFVVVFSVARAQTCGVGGITFGTQVSIDNFNTNNPGCTQVLGPVTISGADITNLNGLSNIATIAGDLTVKDNPLLTSLNGLGGLTDILQGEYIGQLIIYNNPGLTNLSGLGSLTSIDHFLSIGQCNGLISLSGLTSLTTIGEGVSVSGCPLLKDFKGLEAITSLNAVSIQQDAGLTSLDGLESLTFLGHLQDFKGISNYNALSAITSIPYGLEINFSSGFTGLENVTSIGNDALFSFCSNLNGLPSLKTITGTLYILDCQISNLNAFYALESIGGLDLENNENLSQCNIQSICRLLADDPGAALIGNNASGCTAQAISSSMTCQGIVAETDIVNFEGVKALTEIQLSWQTDSENAVKGFSVERSNTPNGFVEIGYVNSQGNSSITQNYTFDDTTPGFQNYYRLKEEKINGDFSYSDIVFVEGNQSTCPIGGINFFTQASINSFSVNYPGCELIEGSVNIIGNDITDLSGLSSITTIKGNLEISSCPLLQSLSGLAGLTSVQYNPDIPIWDLYSGNVRIDKLPQITNLSGLETLTSVDGEFFISDGVSLSSLSGLQGLTNVGSSFIFYNTALVNLNGMPNLTSYGGIVLNNNPEIVSLDGLPSLVTLVSAQFLDNPKLNDIDILNTVTELSNVYFSNNPNLLDLTGLGSVTEISILDVGSGGLTSFEGLGSLSSITYGFSINGPVSSLNGLANLTNISSLNIIGGTLQNFEGLNSQVSLNNLRISSNAITSFAGLNDVTSIRYISISGNSLTNLSGLDNIDPEVMQQLTITNSPNLADCNVKSVCKFLSDPANIAAISNNGAGCATRQEIVSSQTCLTILPVDLISFEGKSNAKGNVLTWKTASETKNKGFEIERSANATSFQKIGFVEGNGDANEENNYSFTDPNPGTITYYRLKQLDFDGTFEHSKIIAVRNGQGAAKVYPNPSRGTLHIESKDKNQPYSIRNVQGFSVMESAVLPSKPLDTSSLQNGLYLITVGKEVFKVAVQN